MRLADLIEANHDRIVRDWESFAAALLPGDDLTTLRDHAGEMLRSVVATLRMHEDLGGGADESIGPRLTRDMRGIASVHARLRMERGLSLTQVVAEYRALRASVLAVANEHADRPSSALYDATRFDDAIDETLMEATASFTQLAQTNRALFLGVLGHDLRNPLNAVAMTASVLASRGGADAELGNRILRSARRMERLLDDLLDLTRTHHGARLPIRPGRTDLVAVCREAIDELRAGNPGAQIELRTEGDLIGEWDSERLAQVVSNLLGNAVEHGSPGAPVYVAARCVAEGVLLDVHNHGAPIPKEALRTLFEPMTSSVDPKARQSHAGLGLYIVQQIVLAHGGRVDVTSTEEEGTTFRVTLPMRAKESRAHDAA